MKKNITCPCGKSAVEAECFVGVTTKSNGCGSETKFAWFSNMCGHYFFLVVRAPNGDAGEYEITRDELASEIDRNRPSLTKPLDIETAKARLRANSGNATQPPSGSKPPF